MLRPHFPTPLTALVLVLAAWLVTIIGLRLAIDLTETPDPGFLYLAQALGFGLVATLAARRVPAPQAERLGLTPLALRFVPLVAMAAPFAIVASELDNLLTLVFPAPDPEAIQKMFEEIRKFSTLAIAQQAIFRVGIEPVVTEFLFRGVILQGVVAYVGRLPGVLVTAALSMDVASAVATSGSPISALVVSLILGLTLGYLRIATGSLLAPILARATWNGMGLFGVIYAEQLPVPGFNTYGDHTHPILLAACSACVVWASIELLRAIRTRPVVLPVEEEPDPEDDEPGYF